MKDKLKHFRVSWFDVILCVLIIAVGAGAFFLVHRGDEAAVQSVRSYTLEFSDVQEDAAGLIQVGDTITDTVKNYAMGVVSEVEVQPCVVGATDIEQGIMREATVDGRITLLVTVQADTIETDTAINLVSGYTVREGAQAYCQIGQGVFSGYIVRLER